MNDKTPNQTDEQLYRFIESYYNNHGYTPSYQEMVDGTSAKSKGHVSSQLKNLEQAGWLERTPNRPRAIKLNAQSTSKTYPTHIPLLGIIQAGAPIPLPNSDFAMFLPEDAVDVGSMLPESPRRRNLFALRVQGDSMIDSNIQNGDTVIMEHTNEAHNGQMVAAWLVEKEETTLKHFYREKDKIRLQPANPKYKPITCHPSQVQVQGRVVMVIRSC
jgi:repressor LexA